MPRKNLGPTVSVQMRLPAALVELMDRVVSSGRFGYSDRADIMRAALREKLEKIMSIEAGLMIEVGSPEQAPPGRPPTPP